MFISLALQKRATNDIMSITYQFITHLDRNLRIPKLLYSRKDKINTAGPCAKLYSSTLRELFIAVSRRGNKLTARNYF
jgi:hypothetical protein